MGERGSEEGERLEGIESSEKNIYIIQAQEYLPTPFTKVTEKTISYTCHTVLTMMDVSTRQAQLRYSAHRKGTLYAGTREIGELPDIYIPPELGSPAILLQKAAPSIPLHC